MTPLSNYQALANMYMNIRNETSFCSNLWLWLRIICVSFTSVTHDNRIPKGLQIVFVCLYITPSQYHHCVNLSEDIERIKCLSGIFCRVCKIDYILSVIQYTIYGAVCFQLTHFTCDDWENVRCLIIIIIKSEVLKENTPSLVVRGRRSLACIKRRIPTHDASKWSPVLLLLVWRRRNEIFG